MKKLFLTTAICSALALGMASAGAGYAADQGQQKTASTVQSENTQATREKFDQKAQEAVIKNAIDAFALTNEAIVALQHKDTAKALTALGDATGKFALVTAANPDLALAPIDESERVVDLYADPQTVYAARTRAIKLLKDGRVQDARALLADMASELVIETTSIPMATYPDAIKAVVPLITSGKIDEAITALQAAMNTLVITDVVLPLPTLRAITAVEAAQAIVNKDKPLTAAQRAKINEELDYARSQLRLAVALGYARKGEFKDLHVAIEQLRKQISGGSKAEKAFKDVLGKLKASSNSSRKETKQNSKTEAAK